MQQRLTVTELTALVKESLEQGVPPVWVEGEVSNFVAHSSGHYYFSLKDARAQLRCVMFRGANSRLRFQPRDGMQGMLFGRVTVYERSGQYQLVVERFLPLGEGELQIAFEALKERLASEGLFAPERKRRLPEFPRTIGVVTSPTGAVIRDIQRVLRRRWPPIRIILRPTPVQGAGAGEQIAAAIGELNTREDVDVLIVGRGGGSLEDLWAFNEEVVARAMGASRIPIVSAVGHEIDHTIADFVADLRAPTPSAAAELVVRDFRDVLGGLMLQRERCGRALTRRIRELRLRLAAIERSHALKSPLDRLQQASQRADELLLRCRRGLSHAWERTRERVGRAAERITALSPLGVLSRGYALAFDANGRIMRSVANADCGDALRVVLGDGALRCRVESVEPGGDRLQPGDAGG